MRPLFLSLLLSPFFFSLFANESGDLQEQDFGSEEITQPAKQTGQALFNFDSYLDVIGKSKISKGFFKGDDIRFAAAQVQLGSVVYYCPGYTEGIRVSLAFTATFLAWPGNPWFDQEHFNLLSLNVTGFTKRLERWFWRSQISINTDTDEWRGPYTSYDIILWGRYAYLKNIGLHIGVWVQTGLRLDRVYPILGADWQFSPNWKLNLVYPVNLAIEYTLSRVWSLALAIRNFNSRFRVHHESSCAKSLLRYTNVGTEFAIRYEQGTTTANLHAGYALGGKYRVANPHNHHAHNYRFDPAPYVGGEVNVRF